MKTKDYAKSNVDDTDAGSILAAEQLLTIKCLFAGGNFRESVGGGSLNTARDGIVGDEEDGEATSTGIALSREIRRPPSRARVYAYRGQGQWQLKLQICIF